MSDGLDLNRKPVARSVWERKKKEAGARSQEPKAMPVPVPLRVQRVCVSDERHALQTAKPNSPVDPQFTTSPKPA